MGSVGQGHTGPAFHSLIMRTAKYTLPETCLTQVVISVYLTYTRTLRLYQSEQSTGHKQGLISRNADDSHFGGHTTTFADSIAEVGEDVEWFGTSYKTWAEIPKKRLKLL